MEKVAVENYTTFLAYYALLILLLIPPAVPLQGSCPLKQIEPIQSRIKGGTPVDRYAYPWIVQIKRDGVHHCTGSVLYENWVITAKHCFGVIDEDIEQYEYELIAGVHNVNGDENDCRQSQIFSSEAIFNHPQFQNIGSGRYLNDIALIKVSPPLITTMCVQPIKIYQNDLQTPSEFTVAGWGSQESSLPPLEVLHEVEIPFVSDSICTDQYDGVIGHEDILLCAGVTGKGACFGDDGSPLFTKSGDGEGHLYGIMSWSTGCGRAGCSDVYTEVSNMNLTTWVYDVIENSPIIITSTTISTPSTNTPTDATTTSPTTSSPIDSTTPPVDETTPPIDETSSPTDATTTSPITTPPTTQTTTVNSPTTETPSPSTTVNPPTTEPTTETTTSFFTPTTASALIILLQISLLYFYR